MMLIPMTRFGTTRWSLLSVASSATEESRVALDELCRIYRPAILAFIRAHGYSKPDAEDLAHDFFAHFLEKRLFATADPQRGRFRVYVQTLLNHFLANARNFARAKRRSPGIQAGAEALDHLPADQDSDPDRVFERAWALVVLRRAIDRLAQDCARAGKLDLFERVSGFLIEHPEPSDYDRISAELGIRRNTLAVNLHRLRQRLDMMIQEVIADTVVQESEIDAEFDLLAPYLGGTGARRPGAASREAE